MISEEKLDFWYENGFNVLIEGRHGVGKSSSVTNFLDDRDINYMYFSCGTMDPWVDFVGVPKEKETENGSYLDLVRPKPLQQDDVEVMVFDEFNRAKSKVKNAVLELVQFKSINGEKFENLKAIWALINPSDDEDFDYDVEPLAPAQKDRFHVQIEVPYRPSKSWFVDEFGKAGAGAVSWWKSLPKNKQQKVTPRRLEYALRMLILDGSVRDVFPEGIHVGQFRKQVDVGDITKVLIELKKKSEDEIERFFQDENNYFNTINAILEDEGLVDSYVRHMPEEKISQLIQQDRNVLRHVVKSKDESPRFQSVIGDILDTHTASSDFKNKLEKYDSAFNSGESVKVGNYIYIEPSESCRIDTELDDSSKTKKEVRSGYNAALSRAENKMTHKKSNTNQRKKVIRDLCDEYVNGVLEKEKVVKTLTGPVLDKFLDRSRRTTVQKFNSFAILFNTCLRDLIRRDKVDSGELLNQVFDDSANFKEYIEECIEEGDETDLCIVVDRWYD